MLMLLPFLSSHFLKLPCSIIDSPIYTAKKLAGLDSTVTFLFTQQNANSHTKMYSFKKIPFLPSSLIITDATNHFGEIQPSSPHTALFNRPSPPLSP